MSRNSRKEILERIKMGLHNSTVVRGTGEKTSLFPSVEKEIIKQKVARLHKELKEKKRILTDRFVDELTKVSGKALIAKSEDEIRELITRLVEEHSAKSLAIWESEEILRLNLREFLQGKGLKFASPKSKEEMAKADIGITEADFAIADTGTIVLIANEKQPRSVSLIPPIHIALIRSDIIVENLEDLFFLVKNSLAKSGSIAELTSCMTFITGPSRTADIELNLTLGVHGPREIIVLIYP